jgi:vacuolar-type H+-ATPase subunit F/Vma7
MSRIVAIGEPELLAGYALAGVEVLAAADAREARAAWDTLDGTGLLILTPAAQAALGDRLRDAPIPWAVLPR